MGAEKVRFTMRVSKDLRDEFLLYAASENFESASEALRSAMREKVKIWKVGNNGR